jgi:hypothetical protein
LDITYQDGDPKVAAAVVNKAMEVYIDKMYSITGLKLMQLAYLLVKNSPALKPMLGKPMQLCVNSKKRIESYPWNRKQRGSTSYIIYRQPNYSTPGSTCKCNCSV